MADLPMHYETTYEWSGGDGVQGTSTAPDADHKPSMDVGGTKDEGWDPEHLLMTATEACHFNTLHAIARYSKLPLKAYRSSAEGFLTKEKGKGYRFEKMIIRAELTVAEGDEEKAERLLQKAHDVCLISRSFNFPVEVEHTILTE